MPIASNLQLFSGYLLHFERKQIKRPILSVSLPRGVESDPNHKSKNFDL